MTLLLKLLAFIFGFVITAYSFVGFKQMKKWKKVLLITSSTISWVAGICIICIEESKTVQAEKGIKNVRHDDSVRDSIAKITCRNTTNLLALKNDSLTKIINNFYINKSIKQTISGGGDNINTGNNSPVINHSPGASINKPLDFYTMENGTLPSGLLQMVTYLEKQNNAPNKNISISVAQESNQPQLGAQIRDFLESKGYGTAFGQQIGGSTQEKIGIGYDKDMQQVTITIGIFR